MAKDIQFKVGDIVNSNINKFIPMTIVQIKDNFVICIYFNDNYRLCETILYYNQLELVERKDNG